MGTSLPFLSEAPSVKLIGAFEQPFNGSLAAARTCYSSRLILPQDVDPDQAADSQSGEQRKTRRDKLAKDLLQAGHHTVFQHAHFQFALGGISRHLVWSFLHNHPFYNSEQVSQRYVSVQAGSAVRPDVGVQQQAWDQALTKLFVAYKKLVTSLTPLATEAFFDRFPGRSKNPDLWHKAIQKKAQEIARYVLPVGATTYLHHTVSGLVLLRYQRAMLCGDLPAEQSLLVGAMVKAVLEVAPGYQSILQEPLPEELFERDVRDIEDTATFDKQLAGKWSRLIGYSPTDISELDQAAGWMVKGSGTLPYAELLTSSGNPVLAQSLNLSFQDRKAQLMHLVQYTFQKVLSHTADSQDQRHRLTPAARPFTTAHLRDDPDFIIPSLIRESDDAMQDYQLTMEQLWEDLRQLRNAGVHEQALQYLLPNAVPIRFYESGDLTALHHKMHMRLCYNAQEEIWRASVDEVEAIAAVHPQIAASLLPPCTQRHAAGIRPVCPEGSRFCGTAVWKLAREAWQRRI